MLPLHSLRRTSTDDEVHHIATAIGMDQGDRWSVLDASGEIAERAPKLTNHAILRGSAWDLASSYKDTYCVTMRSSEKFSSTY